MEIESFSQFRCQAIENFSYNEHRVRKNETLTIGQNIRLLTNCYKFSFKNNLEIDLFVVSFLNSDKEVCDNIKKRYKRDFVMMALASDKNNFFEKNIVYDDSNLLYVINENLNDIYEYCIDNVGKKTYYIRIVKVKHFKIDLKDENSVLNGESKTFLSLMLTQFSKNPGENTYNKNWIGINNKLYYKPDQNLSRENDLDFLRQLLSGISFSILLGPRAQTILNVDQIHGIFTKSELNIIDFYFEVNGAKRKETLLKNASMNEGQRKKMTNLLKGINLSVIYNKVKEFTIYEVVNKLPGKTLITVDGKSLTILDYFKKTYNISLNYPYLPLIQMNPKQANILIPMELVRVSMKPQRLKQKLEGYLESLMVKKCTKLPSIKFSNINKYLKEFKHEANKYLENYDVKIGEQIKTEGKIFPNIYVKCPAQYRDRNFYDKQLKNFTYGIIFIDRFSDEYKKIGYIEKIEHIIRNVSNFGCDFSQNIKPIYLSDCENSNNLLQIIKSNLSKLGENEIKSHLVFFIINDDSVSYGKIKMFCEQKAFIGCHSQVLKLKTINRINTANKMCRVTTNIAMKINGKLGGLSKSLYHDCNDKSLEDFKRKFFDRYNPTIFMGADVIHSSEQKSGNEYHPSISAVVGSMDILGSKYAVSGKIHTTTINKGKQAMETIQYLQEQVKERLLSFEKATGTLPKHIVFFRDGVSDSQFKLTMEYEVKSIHEACYSISPHYVPTITFLVVQKRHGVRIYNTNKNNNNNRNFNGNVPPNTIIASDIVNPTFLDFYAVFHKGLLGTSKPCHIYALYDDWNLTLNEICLISSWMANVCTRCTSSISLPTPCYYADLACTRLKYHYIEKQLLEEKKNSNSISDIEIHSRMKNEQFFV